MSQPFQDYPGAGYLRLRGLPFSSGATEVSDFFGEFGVVEDNVIMGQNQEGRPSGEAWVQFVDITSAEEARRQKDRQVIGGRYIEVFSSTFDECNARTGRGVPAPSGGGYSGGGGFAGTKGFGKSPLGPPAGGMSLAQSALSAMGIPTTAKSSLESMASSAQDYGGSAYLRLRGLPFSSSPSDVAAFFGEYGVSPDHVIMGTEGATGRPSGEAWVQFSSEAVAAQARMMKDRQKIGNRYIEVFPSTAMDASKATSRPMQDRAMRGGKGAVGAGSGGTDESWDWYANMASWFGGKGGDRYKPY